MTTTPHTFEEILYETDNRMFVLHETWCIYRQLFGTSEARVDLLNEVAPGFAGVVQPVLLDSVILGICRLCDPSSMSGNDNLSLKRLVVTKWQFAMLPENAVNCYSISCRQRDFKTTT